MSLIIAEKEERKITNESAVRLNGEQRRTSVESSIMSQTLSKRQIHASMKEYLEIPLKQSLHQYET